MEKITACSTKTAMLVAMTKCQGELHQWGSANQVSFDRDKEGMFILSRARPHGDNFDLLGIHFDCKLFMRNTVEDFVCKNMPVEVNLTGNRSIQFWLESDKPLQSPAFVIY